MIVSLIRPRGSVRAGLLALAAASLLSLASASPVLAEDAKVGIDNFAFVPDVITVKPGTTVTFENHDDIPHLIVDTAGKFRSKALDTGDKFTQQFTTAGTVEYYCAIHPHMTGKIMVTP